MVLAHNTKGQLREYLLNRLNESDKEEVELRLLTDSDYGVELDMIVNEVIDEYVEGKLPESDQQAFQSYFIKSKVRQEKLDFAIALKKRKAKLRKLQRLYKVYLPAAAAAIVLISVSIGIWRTFNRESEVANGLAALQAAYRNQRPLESRISDFSYAPALDQRGGGLPQVDYVQRDHAAGLLFGAATARSTALTRHALGKYYLTQRQFDEAIDQFQAALALDPNNAQIHADLGTALLEAGKALNPKEQDQQIKVFGTSLEHLTRALELNPSLLEARFNRALLYPYMKLPKLAEDDWQKYLEADSNSKWADEAREHLQALKQSQDRAARTNDQFEEFVKSVGERDDERAWELIRGSYTSDGNAIANALLDSYLSLRNNGNETEANRKLSALAYLGQLELTRSEDRYTTSLVHYYERLSRSATVALIEARGHMNAGYKLFLNSNVDEALRRYSQARKLFAENGDEIEAMFAVYREGHCYLLQPDLKRSNEIFVRLLADTERQRFRWLYGQALFRTASILFTHNEYSVSIEAARRALKASEDLDDNNGITKVLLLLADQYRTLNDQQRSLKFLQRALSLTGPGSLEPLQTWGVFTAIGLVFNALGLQRAALDYQREALRLAQELDRPLLIARSYDYLGLTYGRLEIFDEALKNIELALETGKKVSDQRSAKEIMGNSSLHLGDVYRRAGASDEALAAYDRSISLYEELSFPHFTYPAHKGKLLTLIGVQDDRATENEIQTVLNLFAQDRSQLTVETQRNTFFDVEQSIYDVAIDFAYRQKDGAGQAFNYSESSRGRSLLDQMRQSVMVSQHDELPELRISRSFSPETISGIQRRMPAKAQIVQYAVLENKLIIWVINHSDVQAREQAIDTEALRNQVNEFLRAVNEPSTTEIETKQRAQGLYSILIEPVYSLLSTDKLLCVVPDKFLNYLPFDALVANNTGHYLLEDFQLARAPSSTVFVDCSERAEAKKGAIQERILSVGDPLFDSKAFPSLTRLPSAAKEVEAVAKLYPVSRFLVREEADERSVKNEIGKADVLHFALHYVVDDRSNLFSKMVLAHSKGSDLQGDGVLQFLEIAQADLSQCRLAVLSACQTGIERQYGGEGAISLARAFLIAGVPVVVASLWPVDSASTEKLMISFHSHRTRGAYTAEALRRAQLEMIGGADLRYRHPYYWAAFTAIGGYAEY